MNFHGKMLFISVHGDPFARLGNIQSGGQNVYVRELVQALDSLGIEVDVFTHYSDPKFPEEEPLGKNSQVIRLQAGYKGFRSKHQMLQILPKFTSELKQYMGKRNKYTLIHSNYWLSGWVGLQLQKIYRIPRVHTSHSLGIVRKNALGTNNPLLSVRLQIEKEVLQKADKVIATTPLEQKILSDYYSVDPQNISLVPCGVNTNLFHPAEDNKPLGLVKENKKIILFVGRFEENKGLQVLLKSFDILKKKHPSTAAETLLVIVGGDSLDTPPASLSPEKKKYMKFIRENGLSDQVVFTGPVQHSSLPSWYAGAWVTVVPSYYESFGLVALEAMACGCPVIASRTGGLQQNVLHGKTGLLVEPKNPMDLATAINYLITNEKARNEMAKQAALHGKKFTWKKTASNLVAIYKEVADGGRKSK
ncbi:MAG: glycosyltransferase [Firmicutes bacterium]|nr:glycosyltransferase [Bacillota bacterium]